MKVYYLFVVNGNQCPMISMPWLNYDWIALNVYFKYVFWKGALQGYLVSCNLESDRNILYLSGCPDIYFGVLLDSISICL